MKYFFIAPLVMILLVGCGGSGMIYSQKVSGSSKSAIVLYRLGAFGGAAASPMITVNDEEIGLLKNKSYLYYPVSPGSYTVKTVKSLNWGHESSVNVEVSGAELVFVKLDLGDIKPYFIPTPVGTAILTQGYQKMYKVEPDVANKEVVNLREAITISKSKKDQTNLY